MCPLLACFRAHACPPTTPLRGAPDGRPRFRSAGSGSTPPPEASATTAPRRLRRLPAVAGRKDASLRSACPSGPSEPGGAPGTATGRRPGRTRLVPPSARYAISRGPRRTGLQRQRVAFAGGGGRRFGGELFRSARPSAALRAAGPWASLGPLAHRPKIAPALVGPPAPESPGPARLKGLPRQVGAFPNLALPRSAISYRRSSCGCHTLL